jgi:hypothetical protein
MSAATLPAPSLDMSDGEAATWLFELAANYRGVDRRHVEALACRLRRREDDAAAERTAAERKRIEHLRRRLTDYNDEISRTHRDITETERELAALGGTP